MMQTASPPWRICLGDVLPGIEAVVFENAAAMIAWLAENLGQVSLIALDHDLPLRDQNGNTVDCGTGRQVADYRASLPPTCPVVVHSSNDLCAQGMYFTIKEASWPCSRVYPCDDTAWIGASWADAVRGYVSHGRISDSH